MLRQAEASALNNATGAVLAVGDLGLIAYANPEALRLLGWDHALIGRPLSAMVPPELQPAQSEAYGNFVITRQATTYPKVQPAVGRDGRLRQVYVNVAAFERPDGSLFLCSFLGEPRGDPPTGGRVVQDLQDNGYRLIPGRRPTPPGAPGPPATVI